MSDERLEMIESEEFNDFARRAILFAFPDSEGWAEDVIERRGKTIGRLIFDADIRSVTREDVYTFMDEARKRMSAGTAT